MKRERRFDSEVNLGTLLGQALKVGGKGLCSALSGLIGLASVSVSTLILYGLSVHGRTIESDINHPYSDFVVLGLTIGTGVVTGVLSNIGFRSTKRDYDRLRDDYQLYRRR